MGSDDRESSSDVDVESDGGHKDPGTPTDGGETGGGGLAMGCMPITRLGLRSAEFIFTLISFSLLASSPTPFYPTLQIGGVAYLLAFGVITCVYALATIVLLVLALMQPDSDLSYRLPRPLLIADFVLLVNLYAAAASCASSVPGCRSDRAASVCGVLQGGAAMGFLASFTLMADFWLTLVPVFAEI